MQISMDNVGEYFTTSLVAVAGPCERLLDFFGLISKIMSVRIKRKLIRVIIVQYTFHFLLKVLVYHFFT